MPVQVTEAQLFERLGRLNVEVIVLRAENDQLRARIAQLEYEHEGQGLAGNTSG